MHFAVQFGVSVVIISLAAALFASTGFAREAFVDLPDGQSLRYTIVEGEVASARPVALQLLRHLANGDLKAAAQLSNAPQHRYDVLRDYETAVGEEEFKRIYARYFDPDNHVLVETAIGARRLVIWELGEAGNQLAGQFFVEVEGRFVLDDMPSAERAQLQGILAAYRKQPRR